MYCLEISPFKSVIYYKWENCHFMTEKSGRHQLIQVTKVNMDNYGQIDTMCLSM